MRSLAYRTVRHGDQDAFSGLGTSSIFNPELPWTATEHLGEGLATTTARFLATSATTLRHLDQGHFAIERANDALHLIDCCVHRIHQRRSGAMSSKGRNFPETASRARKIRERTVPMGQSMMPAISS